MLRNTDGVRQWFRTVEADILPEIRRGNKVKGFSLKKNVYLIKFQETKPPDVLNMKISFSMYNVHNKKQNFEHIKAIVFFFKLIHHSETLVVHDIRKLVKN